MPIVAGWRVPHPEEYSKTDWNQWPSWMPVDFSGHKVMLNFLLTWAKGEQVFTLPFNGLPAAWPTSMSQRGAAIAMISTVPITLSHRYTSQCSRLCLYRDTKQCKPNVGPKKKKSIKQCRVHNAKTMQSHRKPTRVYISHVVDTWQAIYHLPQSKAHGNFFLIVIFFAFKDAN